MCQELAVCLILPKLIFVGLVTSMYYVIPAGVPAFGRLTCYGASYTSEFHDPNCY